MLLSHIFVVTPGGIGTLLELFYTWQLMQVGHICRAPIILVGEDYKHLQSYIQSSLVEKSFVKTQEAELAIQVDTYEQALALIDEAYKAHAQL
jgi:predicted Rossmann-fold nucleotide-binding protein